MNQKQKLLHYAAHYNESRFSENAPVHHPYYEALLKEKNQRKYYPVSITKEISPQKDITVENLLTFLGFSTVDLDTNSGIFGNEKNPRKLGKFLRSSGFPKYEKYIKDRNNDVSGDSIEEGYIVISANAEDIIKCSTNRRWSSCLDMDKDEEFEFFGQELSFSELSSVIAYLIRKDDKDILDPLGRTFINCYYPFGSFLGNQDQIYSPATRSYGYMPQEIKKEINKILISEINTNRNLVSKHGRVVASECCYFFSGFYIDHCPFYMGEGDKTGFPSYKDLKYPPDPPKNKRATTNQIIEYGLTDPFLDHKVGCLYDANTTKEESLWEVTKKIQLYQKLRYLTLNPKICKSNKSKIKKHWGPTISRAIQVKYS